MNTLLLLLSLLSARSECEFVDRIELNQLVNSDGKEQFRQYVFWRIQSVNLDKDFHVAEWRFVDKVVSRPVKCGDHWQLVWFDQKAKRNVLTRVYVETVSNYDPEVRDRDVLPCEKRRGFACRNPELR
jgi:hypothetical protein